MPTIGRNRRLAAALLFVCLPTPVLAQEPSSLAVPTIAASAAAAADWATTYHALKYYKVREQNPLLRPWHDEPGQLVGVGALMDAGLISGWNLTVGRSHPKAAAAGLWVMTAFRSYLAIHNLRNEQRAAKR